MKDINIHPTFYKTTPIITSDKQYSIPSFAINATSQHSSHPSHHASDHRFPINLHNMINVDSSQLQQQFQPSNFDFSYLLQLNQEQPQSQLTVIKVIIRPLLQQMDMNQLYNILLCCSLDF